jgi:hypothetical protein
MSTYILRKGISFLSDLADGGAAHAIGPYGGFKKVYYVDTDYGSDGNDGSSWEKALKTYLRARTLSNATVDWAHNAYRYNAIVLSPGVYTVTSEAFPYYCWVIGTGVRGTDTSTEFHPATAACFAGTMLGTVLYNLRLEVDQAVDCLNVGTCNNSAVIGCTFTNGAAVAATAMSTDNCTHLEFAYNDVESGQTTGMAYGLYFQGGSNKYAHNVKIHHNNIFCDTAGIWIQDTCTASQAKIYENFIAKPAKGIDDNNGNSYCWNNRICATDGIEHANTATQCVGNQVNEAGTTTWEDGI